MEFFRIAAEKYSTKIQASGSPNRWNKKGEYVIYSGSSRSLTTLELIVHRNFIKPEINYKVMIISVSNINSMIKTIDVNTLPENWRQFEAYAKLQEIGSEWYSSKESLILKVPSAIIPKESNYIINTEHQDFQDNVALDSTENYFWGIRLL